MLRLPLNYHLTRSPNRSTKCQKVTKKTNGLRTEADDKNQQEIGREPNLQKRKKEPYELGNYKRDYLNNVIFKGFQTH